MSQKSKEPLELEAQTATPQEKQLLPWTRCWRKIYAEQAEARGYRCAWGGGELLVVKPGEWYVFVIPPSNPFTMEDLIELAHESAQSQIKKKAEKEERVTTALSRAAAGEPAFLYKRNGPDPTRLRHITALAAIACLR